LTTSKATHKAT